MKPDCTGYPRRFVTALLPLVLLFTLAHAQPKPEEQLERLDHTVVPTFERINLIVNADTTDYSGDVMIAIKVNRPTNHFALHAEKLNISSVTLSQNGTDIPCTFEITHDVLLNVTTKDSLKPGEYQLASVFTNDFSTRANSMYRVIVDSLGYIFTQFEDDDAREAFPCWDEPEFKIPFQMIVTIPKRHIAVSNTPIVSQKSVGNMTRIEFETTPPMPSYIVALATGPLEKTAIPGMKIPGNVVTVKGGSALTADAVRTTPPILAALEKYFGRPYPYKKLDLIGAPEFLYGAMENAGAIVYRESSLLLNPKTRSQQQVRRLASVTAHELSHMWFGDLVTMEWWDDLWLNESFASWMGDKTVVRTFPELYSPGDRGSSANFAMITDARPSTVAIRRPVNAGSLGQIPAELVYSKGEAILQMFETYLGEETFQKGVINYLKKHEWKNAKAEDLWGAIAEAAGIPIDVAIKSFITQPGVPLISVTPLGENRYNISQHRFHNFSTPMTDSTLWQIPITLGYSDGSQMQKKTVLLTDTSTIVELPAKAQVQWVNPNYNADGYYRWSLPTQDLVSLSRNAQKELSPRERVNFVQNLDALLDGGAVSGDAYLSMLSEFANDPDARVVSALVNSLDKVRRTFVVTEVRPAFRTYVHSLLMPAYQRIGFTPQSKEPVAVSSVRTDLINMLADDGGDTTLTRMLDSVAIKYLADRSSVDRTLGRLALSIYASHGDQKLFDDIRARFDSAKTSEERGLYLEALGNFRDSALVHQALDFTFTADLRPQEIWDIPLTIREYSDENANLVLHTVFDNFDKLKAKVPVENMNSLVRMAGGCSQERIDAAQTFFSDTTHGIPNWERGMKRVVDAANDCISLRNREEKAVTEYLHEHASN